MEARLPSSSPSRFRFFNDDVEYTRSSAVRSKLNRVSADSTEEDRKMNRAHLIRLNPTAEQEVYFRKACGVARHAYNWALARWKDRKTGERATMKDLKREYNQIKGEQFPWCYRSRNALLNKNSAILGKPSPTTGA